MKKVLNIFSVVVASIGLAVALAIMFNAPPAEERLEGYIFISNAAERSAAMLKAWSIIFGSAATAIFFAALGAILDRLEAIRDALRKQ